MVSDLRAALAEAKAAGITIQVTSAFRTSQEHTDRKGPVATFTYDALDRPVGARYADGSTTSFSYDAAGRLMQATRWAGRSSTSTTGSTA